MSKNEHQAAFRRRDAAFGDFVTQHMGFGVDKWADLWQYIVEPLKCEHNI